ncbi:hypothetical protein VTK56DRAFT_3681 [Thermocarpiscus australiensis]
MSRTCGEVGKCQLGQCCRFVIPSFITTITIHTIWAGHTLSPWRRERNKCALPRGYLSQVNFLPNSSLSYSFSSYHQLPLARLTCLSFGVSYLISGAGPFLSFSKPSREPQTPTHPPRHASSCHPCFSIRRIRLIPRGIPPKPNQPRRDPHRLRRDRRPGQGHVSRSAAARAQTTTSRSPAPARRRPTARSSSSASSRRPWSTASSPATGPSSSCP